MQIDEVQIEEIEIPLEQALGVSDCVHEALLVEGVVNQRAVCNAMALLVQQLHKVEDMLREIKARGETTEA